MINIKSQEWLISLLSQSVMSAEGIGGSYWVRFNRHPHCNPPTLILHFARMNSIRCLLLGISVLSSHISFYIINRFLFTRIPPWIWSLQLWELYYLLIMVGAALTHEGHCRCPTPPTISLILSMNALHSFDWHPVPEQAENCSSFIHVAIIKCPEKNQYRRGMGSFGLKFWLQSVTKGKSSIYSGTRVSTHIASTV